MRMVRSAVMVTLVSSVLTASVAAQAQTQDYPARPVRVIAASSPGGLSDIFIRVLGDELQKRWGQPLVIENRPGGAFNIPAKACADAAPDGYTICILPADVLQYNRFAFANLNYDMFKDLEPVTLLFNITQGLVVNSKLGVSTLDELAAYARANPKTLSYSAASVPHQMFMDQFTAETGIDIVRVPFKGGGDAVNSVLNGTTPISLAGIGNFAPHITAGTMKGIAVDAERRAPMFPEIPTFKEVRPNQDVTQADFSLFVPRGVPAAIIRRVRDEVAAVAVDKGFVERHVVQRGLVPVFNTPEQFAAYLADQRLTVERMAKKANLKPQ